MESSQSAPFQFSNDFFPAEDFTPGGDLSVLGITDPDHVFVYDTLSQANQDWNALTIFENWGNNIYRKEYNEKSGNLDLSENYIYQLLSKTVYFERAQSVRDWVNTFYKTVGKVFKMINFDTATADRILVAGQVLRPIFEAFEGARSDDKVGSLLQENEIDILNKWLKSVIEKFNKSYTISEETTVGQLWKDYKPYLYILNVFSRMSASFMVTKIFEDALKYSKSENIDEKEKAMSRWRKGVSSLFGVLSETSKKVKEIEEKRAQRKIEADDEAGKR